jgi:hypothetical protein
MSNAHSFAWVLMQMQMQCCEASATAPIKLLQYRSVIFEAFMIKASKITERYCAACL